MGHRTNIAVLVATAGLLIATGCGTNSDSGGSATSTPVPAQAEPAYAATLRPMITQLIKDNVIPGAVVVVKSPTKGNWTETFGTRVIGADDPMSVDDYFRIASNTKTMTSTVILQLVQEGKLALDDPIGKYWPGVPNGDRITIAQLSEMRSGLYSYTFDPQFNALLDSDPNKVWTPEELLAIAFSHPVNFAPGEKFDYSNTNIILLGLVIEKITKMSAAENFQQRIFEPLGLKHTSLPAAADPSIPDPHPQGYAFGTNVSTIDTYALPPEEQAAALAGTLQPSNATDESPSWTWTAGAAISTVDDVATYVRALVEGDLLDEQTQRVRMDSIQPIDPAAPDVAGYGLGIVRFGLHLFGHDGQMPGFMTFMGHDPASDLTIVVATNLATVPSGEGSALVLVKAMLPTFYGPEAVPGNPAAPSTGATTSPTSPAGPTTTGR
ncbi:serine hydrolase domain-containing protein [Nocardia sp. PE-7]|uniref:serine hydrolase domain-containing protein n=1 Tax=Nocardia sp. PE-7 TaxID=3058426 RepID=UPI00265833DA|nr:serine hydrolase domain-containing protein [Nocardia sp. PE-7]WKG11870.1 serine hydrolase domain-containing protein [Nocardia sp. PE-7]